jgi:hypothetical protein
MPPAAKIAGQMEAMPEASQKPPEYRPEPTTAFAEAATIAFNDQAEAQHLNIDTEKFTEVSAHGGSMKEMIQRFKDNPNAPLPQCVKNLGIMSTEQLIKRVEGTDDPSKRAPTIREKREAKRREAERQTIKTSAVEKSDKATNTEPRPIAKVEHDTDKKPLEALVPDKTVAHVLAQQHVARIVSEVVEVPARSHARVSVGTEAAGVKPAKESLPRPIIAKTENVSRQRALDIATGSNSQTSSATLASATDKVSNMPEVERPVKVEAAVQFEKILDPVVEAATEEPGAEIADNISNYTKIAGEDIATDTELEDTIVEESPFDIKAIMAGLGLSYSDPEAPDSLEDPGQMTELAIDYEDVEAPELNVETLLDTVSLAFAVSLRETGLESAETTAESEGPFDLRTELNAYIESLAPDKARAAETALKSLFAALESTRRRTDTGEETPATIESTEIEGTFAELLTALNLDIDLLNYLGTHEYQSTSISSFFSQLIQLIKQKVQPHLRLGKYALTASGSY